MSREAELYKDKIEVSLDGRQIFYLFFGGAVIVGLVFVLGVMVGRRVEARGHTDRARVSATVDPLAALDRLEGGSGLSFQGALRGAEGPVSDVEKTIAAMPKKDVKGGPGAPASGLKHEDRKADKREDEKKVDKAVDKKDDKPVEKQDDKAAKVEKPAEKQDDKAAKVEKPAAKQDDKAADKKDDRPAQKLDVKLAEKSDGKPSEKADVKAEKKDEPKEEKKSKFTLQLSSFQDKSEAQAYLDSIKAAGYQAYVTEGAVDGKQYYRVRMGSYRSLDAANDAKAEFEKNAKKSAVVMKL